MAHGRSGEAGLPQSSPLMKFPMRPKKKSQRYERSHKIRQLPKLHAMSADIERHHDKHSQQTAMRTHSALPN